MAFLDNSGDIILDAVLTDTGRMRLAKGDGTFRITKFALGDDEIDYSLYNGNNSSGSAYFDLEILQTPVFEAFTNNVSSMKSKLISISRNNLLYLPVMKLNTPEARICSNVELVNNGYVLAVDQDTQDFFSLNTSLKYGASSQPVGSDGVLKGIDNTGVNAILSVAQGLDTEQLPYTQTIDDDLRESQYLIEIDDRFAKIMNPQTASVQATVSYIDDDNIASYYISNTSADADFIKNFDEGQTATSDLSVLKGPRGTKLLFKLASQNDVKVSRYLFDQLGTDITSGFTDDTVRPGNEVRGILTNIRVTGITTGNSIDIPLLLVKKIS